MSANSSFSTGNFSDPLSTSNSSTVPYYLACQHSVPRMAVFTMYAIISTLLFLPLYIFVLYIGIQKWRHQRFEPARISTNPSDFYTLNMMISEIICALGSALFVLAMFSGGRLMYLLGLYFFSINVPGQSLFHSLTCLDRYLAVVHPITYMLKKDTLGVRIRNISNICVWLLCFGYLGIVYSHLPNFPIIPFFTILGISISVMFFCCFSVLWGLTHSAPGEVQNHKKQVDQTKQRAFYIILAITSTLMLRFTGLLVGFGLKNVGSLDQRNSCGRLDAAVLLTLPSSLVLPLLFLHRAGKLSCWK
ncbi:uncharacterized protein LOC119797144 [Cyprinodon tularosa]|uniref:uncharacterized protein LOC119797144 n=1 Tax=Cyprinodon tularosa TaxID=77115 RepID=UPI0018E1E7BA|nr:uncharacterized protein LOC119797144 [Cyprinodon tularosa]